MKASDLRKIQLIIFLSKSTANPFLGNVKAPIAQVDHSFRYGEKCPTRVLYYPAARLSVKTIRN
jgi:hypothetical protein